MHACVVERSPTLLYLMQLEDDAEEMAQRRLETILGARLSVIMGIRPSAQSDAQLCDLHR